MAVGWGGLVLLIFYFEVPPLVWARWGFFALWFIALTGTALPVAYYFNLRFPSVPPAEAEAIVRQAMWVGFYGSALAWFQLGHLITLWVWMGLAGGLIAIESLIRWRERARWRPPSIKSQPSTADTQPSPLDDGTATSVSRHPPLDSNDQPSDSSLD